MKAQCPECDAWIRVPGAVELWDTMDCPECNTELQLISANPPELDYADFDDYDDDLDDDDLDDDYEDYEDQEDEDY